MIEEMTERKPVVDLSEELTHVGRVFRLHLPLEPVHLVHVLAVRKNKICNNPRLLCLLVALKTNLS